MVRRWLACSLRHWLVTARPDAAAKRSLLRQVLLAMACIHSQKIVHCDIKGENVLVADDCTPRICDFEMSKDLDAALSSTMAGGTRGFMAPEVVSGQSKPSPASDMFAFGVLVLNTGTFDNKNAARVCPQTVNSDSP